MITVYADNFAMEVDEYETEAGLYDEEVIDCSRKTMIQSRFVQTGYHDV